MSNDSASAAGIRASHWLLGGAGVAAVAIAGFMLVRDQAGIDPNDKAVIAAGKRVYDQHCAACHGAHREGQPNWRERLPNGRLPAPPHDASGHTWHHPDAVLFDIVKQGLLPGRYAPPGYESDMPAFGGTLSEQEIRSVLAYIKSTWPKRELARQREIDRASRAAR